jgi:Cu/Ag efflux pump CusA
LSLTRRPLILLFLLVFAGAGLFAYSKLNIEAYPNPAPVILEITAQAPGLSAEEMERYYTVPMEVGLAATPGVESIRSTSFYGLSFVRVTFKYGVDYYFAYTQAALNLQQNVSLPNNVQPQIQASSLVGEIYRYQLRGRPLRADKSAHAAGLGARTATEDGAGRGAGGELGWHDQGVRRRGRPAQARRVQHHAAADDLRAG